MALTEKKVREAIAKARGNLTGAGRELGVSRQAVNDAVVKWNLGQHVIDSRSLRVEKAEDVLDRAVDARAPWAVSLTLKCLGKHLGYIERLPDVVAAANLDVLRRFLAHLGLEDVDDETLLKAVVSAQAEAKASRDE
ncbi:MAG: hypothetical protein LCH53_13655 [Bacteroidetes bacterium]|nr:hypothetical protein [Bacteroidota bacterium]